MAERRWPSFVFSHQNHRSSQYCNCGSWGYDRLYPVDVTEDTPEIHAYIKEFYRRNCTAAPSVADAASLCMKMEHGLKSEWLVRGLSVPSDEISLSNAIHQRASDLLGYKTDAVSTFPYAAIACVQLVSQRRLS